MVKNRLFWPKNGPSENCNAHIVGPPKHPLYTSNLCLKMHKVWFKHCRGCRRAPYDPITHPTFHMLLAGTRFSNSQNHALHSIRCYRAASLLFQHEKLSSTFRTANQHIRWTIARLVSSFEANEAIESYANVLKQGTLPGSDLNANGTVQKCMFEEYLVMLKACNEKFTLNLPRIVNKSFVCSPFVCRF